MGGGSGFNPGNIGGNSGYNPGLGGESGYNPGYGYGDLVTVGDNMSPDTEEWSQVMTGTAPETGPSLCGRILSGMDTCLLGSQASLDTIQDMTNQSHWIRQMAGIQAMVRVDLIPGAFLDFPIMLTMKLAKLRDSRRN